MALRRCSAVAACLVLAGFCGGVKIGKVMKVPKLRMPPDAHRSSGGIAPRAKSGKLSGKIGRVIAFGFEEIPEGACIICGATKSASRHEDFKVAKPKLTSLTFAWTGSSSLTALGTLHASPPEKKFPPHKRSALPVRCVSR